MIPVIAQLRAPQGPLDMVLAASWPTQVVLGVLCLFSVIALWVILAKLRHFGRVRRDGDEFLDHLDDGMSLSKAQEIARTLPESPYTRVFTEGSSFLDDLWPDAAGQGGTGHGAPGVTLTQLEALRMVMDKVRAEEGDDLAHGLTWLAVIGSVSPLLGLMGTVIGIMNTFLGITRVGSTNISAVAPGIAEALITTVAGLAVAIPAVMAYNHFVSRLNLVHGELEGFASEFIGALAKERRI